MKLTREQFARQLLDQLDAIDRVARSLSRADADDLVQETCLNALKAYDGFALQPFGIRPWLLRILHNLFVNRVRRHQRAPRLMEDELLEAVASLVPPPALPLDGTPFSDARLDDAMGQLPVELRTTLMLWGVDELSYKEISHVLDVPIGTVMSRLYRARQRLAELLVDHPAARRRE